MKLNLKIILFINRMAVIVAVVIAKVMSVKFVSVIQVVIFRVGRVYSPEPLTKVNDIFVRRLNKYKDYLSHYLFLTKNTTNNACAPSPMLTSPQQHPLPANPLILAIRHVDPQSNLHFPGPLLLRANESPHVHHFGCVIM